jgi:hypothetical protein
MDNPPCDCIGALCLCPTKNSIRQFTLCCMFIPATLPVSTATAERTFSVLKHIKLYSRSSTSIEERLTGLSLAYIHLDIDVAVDISVCKTVDLNVDLFATKQDR